MLIGDNMPKENIDVIRFKFIHGVYSVDDLIYFVKIKKMTEDDFKSITRYDYKSFLEMIKGE